MLDYRIKAIKPILYDQYKIFILGNTKSYTLTIQSVGYLVDTV